MSFFITGTDTDVGKTVAAAWLMLHLKAAYWKPVQCGFEPCTDAQRIQNLTGCAPEDIYPTVYNLPDPLSPHEAAKRAGVRIDLEKFELPKSDKPVIVEGAGGVLVPLNETNFIADLIARLDLPLILVCRTTLGTINHSLLSIEAIRARGLKLAGVILSGPDIPHNREAIETYGKVKVLGHIPELEKIERQVLLSVQPFTRTCFDIKTTNSNG